MYLGENAGFYELAGGEGQEQPAGGDAPTKTAFAANLLDSDESAIETAKELLTDEAYASLDEPK